MINKQLTNPASIVVVGASQNTQKPGGKLLKNLLDHRFAGKLYAVNPKESSVQGVETFSSVDALPQVDMAILAIAAPYCVPTVEVLAKQKGTKAFIIISAGFKEESQEGAGWEKQIVETINSVGGCLIGPNCIGMMNANFVGVFSLPIPQFTPMGVDFITGSGATAVFILEAAISNGLRFNSVYSVGNSAQIGVEDVLQYLDETYVEGKSSPLKMLYMETVSNPEKLLKHASSLIRKGCRIAAIKAGASESGSRAASSHTGALAGSDVAVDALFRKAGIVRCYGRADLLTVMGIFTYPQLKGKNIAIITHAGGPAVMLTDTLSTGGLNVPPIEGPKAKALLQKLYPGSSVANPIDILATGNADQLGQCIEACESDFDNIDGIVVIFGSPGLFPVDDVYEVLYNKMQTCSKPIYPVLPSIINVKRELEAFIARGKVNFPDEVYFGEGLCKIMNTPKPAAENPDLPKADPVKIQKALEGGKDGYLPPYEVQCLLDSVGIPRAPEAVAFHDTDLPTAADLVGFPLVMKVIGPLHKSDVGGVSLNINNNETLHAEFERMMKIDGAHGVLMQPMLSGTQLFVGAKREGNFGHVILCGLGGIFVEVLKDVVAGLAPLSKQEALGMIRSLKGYKLIQGVRGQEGVNEEMFADVLVRLSALLAAVPEIAELDLNPLLGKPDKVVAVDARIRIEKR